MPCFQYQLKLCIDYGVNIQNVEKPPLFLGYITKTEGGFKLKMIYFDYISFTGIQTE